MTMSLALLTVANSESHWTNTNDHDRMAIRYCVCGEYDCSRNSISRIAIKRKNEIGAISVEPMLGRQMSNTFGWLTLRRGLIATGFVCDLDRVVSV
jgi:hypothetical protein